MLTVRQIETWSKRHNTGRVPFAVRSRRMPNGKSKTETLSQQKCKKAIRETQPVHPVQSPPMAYQMD